MAMEYKNHRAFPLRLSPFMRQQADVLARRAGVSLQSFISLAIVEKLKKARIDTSSYDGSVVQASTPASRP